MTQAEGLGLEGGHSMNIDNGSYKCLYSVSVVGIMSELFSNLFVFIHLYLFKRVYFLFS